MRKIIYGMLVSLDGYVAGSEGGPQLPPPDEKLHWYFNDIAKRISASLYGRRMYEVMQYWDTADKQPESTEVEVDFARAWQKVPKVVFSTTLRSVGSNARLVKDNVEAAVKALKAEPGGDMEVAGPALAASLSKLGLIDEYRLYVHPIVLGGGKPFFAEGGGALNLKFLGTEKLPQDVVLMRYGRAS
jgi:dihydrofolate reductase